MVSFAYAVRPMKRFSSEAFVFGKKDDYSKVELKKYLTISKMDVFMKTPDLFIGHFLLEMGKDDFIIFINSESKLKDAINFNIITKRLICDTDPVILKKIVPTPDALKCIVMYKKYCHLKESKQTHIANPGVYLFQAVRTNPWFSVTITLNSDSAFAVKQSTITYRESGLGITHEMKYFEGENAWFYGSHLDGGGGYAPLSKKIGNYNDFDIFDDKRFPTFISVVKKAIELQGFIPLYPPQDVEL